MVNTAPGPVTWLEYPHDSSRFPDLCTGLPSPPLEEKEGPAKREGEVDASARSVPAPAHPDPLPPNGVEREQFDWVRRGRIGEAPARLVQMQALVDVAVQRLKDQGLRGA
jgi:hypothetical protein